MVQEPSEHVLAEDSFMIATPIPDINTMNVTARRIVMLQHGIGIDTGKTLC